MFSGEPAAPDDVRGPPGRTEELWPAGAPERERERDARELLWQYSNNLTSGGRGGAYIKRKKKKPAAAAVPVHRRPFFFLSRRNKYRRRRFRGFRLLSNGRVFAPRADGYYYYIPDPLAVFSPP